MEYQDGHIWGPKVETGCPLLAAPARVLSPALYHQAGPGTLSGSHSHAVQKGQHAFWDKGRVPAEGYNA